MDEPVYVVFNPHSGKGRGAQFVGPVLQALAPARRLEHGLTQGPGDEARLAEEAIRRGFRRIVAVGGDGTWSNVGNAILRTGLPAKLGLVPGGTGCDLAKTLGIPARDIAACCRIVLDGVSRRIDVGRIEDKHFLNIAGFGYDIAVIEDSWNVAYLEGGALYLYCALRQLRSFRGFPLEGEVDGRPLGRSDLLMLIVANARIFGGGFRIAPHADVSDGKLEAVAFSNMGFAGRLSVLVRLLRGAHLSHPRVSAVSASRLVYRFAAPPAYETDGEWNQARSPAVVIEAVPGALEVLVPGR
ncbi:MAG TPA: diacylglycerol kinase family protein [Vicinamibacteria bacterium]|nr:diacylglycerol kinase family protein [Vicinamibacteria bacterium]